MISGFRAFLMRGNVIDLAVAVVIGAAFNALVQALVKDLLTPLVAAIFGKPDFSALTFEINNSKFLYGDFINAIVAFLTVAAAVYYFVVVPLTRMGLRADPAVAKLQSCPECLGEIPQGARRCKFCASPLAA